MVANASDVFCITTYKWVLYFKKRQPQIKLFQLGAKFNNDSSCSRTVML
jgi:hypothetical protein